MSIKFTRYAFAVSILALCVEKSSSITLSKNKALSFLSAAKSRQRSSRSNSGFFEESTAADFERECIQERCSSEELHETLLVDYEKLNILDVDKQKELKKNRTLEIYNRCWWNFLNNFDICTSYGTKGCKNEYNNYTCDCNEGWSGKDCDKSVCHEKNAIGLTDNSGDCQSCSDQNNGNKLTKVDPSTNTCVFDKCKGAYSGENCDICDCHVNGEICSSEGACQDCYTLERKSALKYSCSRKTGQNECECIENSCLKASICLPDEKCEFKPRHNDDDSTDKQHYECISCYKEQSLLPKDYNCKVKNGKCLCDKKIENDPCEAATCPEFTECQVIRDELGSATNDYDCVQIDQCSRTELNPCLNAPEPLDLDCVNVEGGPARCECKNKELEYNETDQTCSSPDPCEDFKCPQDSTKQLSTDKDRCKCVCNTGHWNSLYDTCDECTLHSHCSSSYQTCLNNTCVDIDECLTDQSHKCGSGTRCVNRENGYDCEDIDECAEGIDDCTDQQTCRNLEGGFTCEDIIVVKTTIEPTETPTISPTEAPPKPKDDDCILARTTDESLIDTIGDLDRSELNHKGQAPKCIRYAHDNFCSFLFRCFFENDKNTNRESAGPNNYQDGCKKTCAIAFSNYSQGCKRKAKYSPVKCDNFNAEGDDLYHFNLVYPRNSDTGLYDKRPWQKKCLCPRVHTPSWHYIAYNSPYSDDICEGCQKFC